MGEAWFAIGGPRKLSRLAVVLEFAWKAWPCCEDVLDPLHGPLLRGQSLCAGGLREEGSMEPHGMSDLALLVFRCFRPPFGLSWPLA